MRKTKIICTLGPAVDSVGMMKKLLQSGANAMRFNFSHGSHEEHKARLEKLRKAAAELGIHPATILDTKGPEIRIKAFEKGRVTLKSGDRFTITTEDVEGDNRRVATTYDNLHNELKHGDRILLDDGLIELKVAEVCGKDVVCNVMSGGDLSDQKSMNIPGVSINVAGLTEADERDIRFAVDNDMDFIAASFIRRAADVLAIRSVLRRHGGEGIRIISKLENREGIKNLTEIIEASDAIMVARGDLGVEVNAWEVPILQKRIIREGSMAGKPVIVATQMLDSMIRNPRPTRAEVSDVANAVFDGASCVMLSGETAAGKYPIESVVTMDRTARAAEGAIDYWKRFRELGYEKKTAVNDAITHACCMTAMDLSASAIVTVTSSGHTARMISRFRPHCPIIALTENNRVRRQLSISWGVTPEAVKRLNSTDELFEEGVRRALETGIVKYGETVVLTAGVPVGISGTTNLIKAQKIT